MGKNIESPQNSVQHLEAAAKCYQEAAKYHEAGDHERAQYSIIKAQNHTRLASKI